MDLGALARPTSSPALLLELSELPTPTKTEALDRVRAEFTGTVALSG